MIRKIFDEFRLVICSYLILAILNIAPKNKDGKKIILGLDKINKEVLLKRD